MMRKPFIALLLVALLMGLPRMGWAYPPVQEVKTDSGITAWLMQVESLPVITMRIAFNGAGSAYDGEAQQGLAALTSEMLLEGTQSMDAATFHAELESYAIDIGFSVGDDYLIAEVKTLKENQDKAFALLAAALTQPALSGDSLKKVKQKFASSRRRQQQFPGYVAQRTLHETIFEGHGYSLPVLGTDETVDKLSAESLRRFIMERLTQDRMVIAVSGDIDADTLSAQLHTHLAVLPARGVPFEPLPEDKPKAKGVIHHTMDAAQSTILFSTDSVFRHDPDFYAVYVLNHIVGSGGFASLIMQTLREEEGLIYSASSSMGGYMQVPTLVGSLSTRTEQADDTLARLQALLADVRQGSITKDMMNDAITDITGSLPLRLDTTGKMTAYLLSMQLNTLGTDYLEKRNSYFEAVTLDDIQRLAGLLLNEDRMTYVVTGPYAASAESAADANAQSPSDGE